MITLHAFKWVPPFAQGLVRDLRVRWALEEAGLGYREKLIGPADQSSAEYRALQPFGQVPVLQDDATGVELFESGSIVLYIANKSPVLMPHDAAGRARATTWVFCALNSIETFVQQLSAIDLFYKNEAWAKLRRPEAEAAVKKRLHDLATCLGDRDYLEDRFTVGDLMMTSVLRILRHTDLVASEPNLAAYQARCEARPAFQRALAAQMAPFAANAPPAN
jgi:glutathione S-transferase